MNIDTGEEHRELIKFAQRYSNADLQAGLNIFKEAATNDFKRLARPRLLQQRKSEEGFMTVDDQLDRLADKLERGFQEVKATIVTDTEQARETDGFFEMESGIGNYISS